MAPVQVFFFFCEGGLSMVTYGENTPEVFMQMLLKQIITKNIHILGLTLVVL